MGFLMHSPLIHAHAGLPVHAAAPPITLARAHGPTATPHRHPLEGNPPKQSVPLKLPQFLPPFLPHTTWHGRKGGGGLCVRMRQLLEGAEGGGWGVFVRVNRTRRAGLHLALHSAGCATSPPPHSASPISNPPPMVNATRRPRPHLAEAEVLLGRGYVRGGVEKGGREGRKSGFERGGSLFEYVLAEGKGWVQEWRARLT